MSVTVNETAFVDNGTQPIGLASLIDITPTGSNPAYIVVSAIDRLEYTATSTGQTGSFSGNGQTLNMSVVSASADLDGTGIVFQYNSTTGQYTNATYGNLSQVVYNPSHNTNDMTQIGVYATNNVADTAYSTNFVSMQALYGTADYVGSATVATQPSFTGTVPAQATPISVEAAALTFVGKVWNIEGCWPLASTIAAEAGAGLPASTLASFSAVNNGEWFVAYNGATTPNSNWQSLLTAGEIVTIPGHITTVVSGSGSTAMLVDNADTGSNSAKDGDANDIIITAPHTASGEFNGIQSSGVTIYELDCPIISTTAAPGKTSTFSLSSFLQAVDPNNSIITEYQVYDLLSGDKFTVNGQSVSATSAANACTVASLSAITFNSTGSGDTIEVRAENALGYWGDWTSLNVNGGSTSTTTTTATPPGPVASAISDQTWTQAKPATFALLSGTFTDSTAMTYTATLSNGAALPSWLKFNASTLTFSGTVPAGANNLSVTVTATDTSGLSASDTFNLNVVLNPIGKGISAQTWNQGQAVDFILANYFSDPNGQTLTYTAKLASGAALPSWLSVNSATGEITGTAPAGAANMSIVITATDTAGLSASETLSVTMINNPNAPTIATQTWKQGQAVSFTIPAFTDPNKQTLTYTATESDGSALPSWLKFNASTHAFSGTVPAGAADFDITVTATDKSGLTASDTFHVDTLLAPTVTTGSFQTQMWLAGKAVDVSLPSGTFSDPNGQTLTYTAKLASGAALPAWLHVNAATGELTGTAPTGLGNLTVVETAKDASGLSASVSIAVTAIRAPILAHHEANQTFKQGQTVNLSLSNEFTDPQHQSLTYAVTRNAGEPLPDWLQFNATNDTLTGTVPATAGTIGLVVTATNSSGLSVVDHFNLTTIAAPTVTTSGGGTATFQAGANNSLTLAGVFVDPQNQKMTYTATQASGAALPSWLHFNAATDTFTGTPKVGNLSIGALEALTPAQWETYGPAPVTVKVTAHDASGLTASETFTIDVSNTGLVGVNQTNVVHFG